MRCLEEIKKAIKWYYDLPNDYRNVELLMAARRKLSVHAFELSDITGDTKISLDNMYAERKIEHARSKVALMAGTTAAAAESKAIIENKERIKQEKEYEGLYSRCRLLLVQTNEVLNCLNQHISLLKMEKDEQR